MNNLYVRFERGRDGIIGPTYGPYDFIQVTYDILRATTPDGTEAEIAYHGPDDWVLVDDEREDREFSDYIIYSE
jgi:hypothetical protein